MPQRRHVLKTAVFGAVATALVTALPHVWAASSKRVTPLPRGAACDLDLGLRDRGDQAA